MISTKWHRAENIYLADFSWRSTNVHQHSSIRPSIFFHSSRVGLWGHQPKQRNSDFPLLSHLAQLLLGNSKTFPGQLWNIVLPACSRPSYGSPPGGTSHLGGVQEASSPEAWTTITEFLTRSVRESPDTLQKKVILAAYNDLNHGGLGVWSSCSGNTLYDPLLNRGNCPRCTPNIAVPQLPEPWGTTQGFVCFNSCIYTTRYKNVLVGTLLAACSVWRKSVALRRILNSSLVAF